MNILLILFGLVSTGLFLNKYKPKPRPRMGVVLKFEKPKKKELKKW
jgi:hypothetical protein